MSGLLIRPMGGQDAIINSQKCVKKLFVLVFLHLLAFFFVIPVEQVCQKYQNYINLYEHCTVKTKKWYRRLKSCTAYTIHLSLVFTSCQFWPIQGKMSFEKIFTKKDYFGRFTIQIFINYELGLTHPSSRVNRLNETLLENLKMGC